MGLKGSQIQRLTNEILRVVPGCALSALLDKPLSSAGVDS